LAPCELPLGDEGSCYDGLCGPGGWGNGIVDPGETCDDGNTEPDRTCSSDCQSTNACGNDRVDVEIGEECDDGNAIDNDGCSRFCNLESPTWKRWQPPRVGRYNFGMVYEPH
jgi:cysteine-rich repeat protein